MSMFTYPRHAGITEMINKESKWTAKFIRQQREERAEKERTEREKLPSSLSRRSQSSSALQTAGLLAADREVIGTPPSRSTSMSNVRTQRVLTAEQLLRWEPTSPSFTKHNPRGKGTVCDRTKFQSKLTDQDPRARPKRRS